jgi:glucose 1-dehydrogenase
MSASEQLLKDQVALVTGANSGIGEASARTLAAAGAAVGINYVVNPEAAERVAGEIVAAGGRAVALKADVSVESEVERMFGDLVRAFGTIDILVNNAGILRDAPIAEMTLEAWNTVLGVNLTGQFLCARQAIREFRRRGVRAGVSVATRRSPGPGTPTTRLQRAE